MTTGVYTPKNLQHKPDGSHTFDVRQRVSYGLQYMDGFRYTVDGRLLMPSVRVGPGRYKALVKLPKNARAEVRNKVVRMIANCEVCSGTV